MSLENIINNYEYNNNYLKEFPRYYMVNIHNHKTVFYDEKNRKGYYTSPGNWIKVLDERGIQKSIGVYAIEDENGIHEITTGKEIKKWTVGEYLPDNYFYCQRLSFKSEEDVANDLSRVISNPLYLKRYIDKLNSLENEYGEKYIKQGEEKAKAVRIKTEKELEEQKVKTKNLSILHSFKPNN